MQVGSGLAIKQPPFLHKNKNNRWFVALLRCPTLLSRLLPMVDCLIGSAPLALSALHYALCALIPLRIVEI